MTPEKLLSSQKKYQGHIINLRIDTIQTSDGRETTREIIEHEPCIAVVAVDKEGKILLVRQFRRAADRELLEIPAGGIEPGEDPVAAVKREMSEETGYMPQTVTRLGGFYSSPGFCTEYLYLFLATDMVPNRLHAEDTEDITLVRVTLDEAVELVMSNNICDSKSVAGILTYQEYLRRKQ
jgi:ADP-ribose pyrophosphatase